MKRLALALFVVAIGSVFGFSDVLSYVGKEDPSYAWTKASEKPFGENITIVDLSMTSQTWMGIPWKHTVRILVPKSISKESSKCGLYITGDDPRDEDNFNAGLLVAATGWPFAVIYNIPNQPLYDNLEEDALIAYTFQKMLETQDKDWPLLFPMTKSVVRAMDTIQSYASESLGAKIDGFMTFGASKRGWTTWFTAVVDPRVKGIAPIVYDNLSLEKQMPHQIECYGAYSQEIDDYTELNLPAMLSSEQGRGLAKLVDPYTYRQRITVPKLIIMGTNDAYWTLDSSSLYAAGLYGKKFFLYCPNQGHGINDKDRLLQGIGALALMLDGRIPCPELVWDCAEDGQKVTLNCSSKPGCDSMAAWIATSPKRDFRESVWTSTAMTGAGVSNFTFEMPKPKEGYAALFGEYVFDVEGRNVYLSTNPYVIGPDPQSKEVKILLKP